MSPSPLLLLQITPGDTRPIGRQIVDAIRRKIAAGELQPGDALPSVRGLAQQLTVNPNTVAKAYQELSAEGWCDARPGLGLFVAPPRPRLSESEKERRLNEAMRRFVDEVIGLDISLQTVLTRLADELHTFQKTQE